MAWVLGFFFSMPSIKLHKVLLFYKSIQTKLCLKLNWTFKTIFFFQLNFFIKFLRKIFALKIEANITTPCAQKFRTVFTFLLSYSNAEFLSIVFDRIFKYFQNVCLCLYLYGIRSLAVFVFITHTFKLQAADKKQATQFKIHGNFTLDDIFVSVDLLLL